MELRQFRYFVAVAEELHFTRAAERLHIGQPPLSLQIQAIERELGVTLLKRTRRKVELTAAGELFLQEARLALMQAARAIDTAKRAARGEMGTLRVNFITSVPLVNAFTTAVRRFRLALPDVHLELKIKPSPEIIDDVLLNTIDIGFTRPALQAVLPSKLKATPVHRDKLMLVLPIDHPLSHEDAPISIGRLKTERFVLRPLGTGAGFYEQVFSMCTEAGFSPLIVQEATEAATILGLVAAGVGITIAPQALQSIMVHDVVWRHLSDAQTDSEVVMIHNRTASNLLRDQFISGLKPLPDSVRKDQR
ncbi:LysR family transcriptional regulator [Rhizobium sp. P32RR-XVIII]|uniref:LysR substrate-binding domain-containing protein n=1 Tax=Rhizobium sp. P32RR-XVIII TaxID=2726738 RepID=UPI00145796BA|nr:LysR substrate-binding domain-containing protein [Rhizobium sp. P32RR-XVIII]NLS03479.1 LysR family transcriptional regulator [Rhizobium sp. P32RR-XVIII]